MSHPKSPDVLLRIYRNLFCPLLRKQQAIQISALLQERDIELAWCLRIIEHPFIKEVQEDESLRLWGAVPERGGRYLRVVVYPDGSIRTTFWDDAFTKRVHSKPHLSLESVRERFLNRWAYKRALRHFAELEGSQE